MFEQLKFGMMEQFKDGKMVLLKFRMKEVGRNDGTVEGQYEGFDDFNISVLR